VSVAVEEGMINPDHGLAVLLAVPLQELKEYVVEDAAVRVGLAPAMKEPAEQPALWVGFMETVVPPVPNNIVSM
jgi:hypothetical protein